MRSSWFVERIARGAAKPHWQAERATLSEVLDDLHAAQAAGDLFRFIAPWHATDEELDDLIRRGGMPTFPGSGQSGLGESPTDMASKEPRKDSGGQE